MGQYLTIGLVTSIAIGKERAMKKASAAPEEVRNVVQEVYNRKGIYNVTENDDGVYLKLKPEVANAEMTDFLEEFYRLRYGVKDWSRKAYMDKIKSRKTLVEWLKLADGSCMETFQLDQYVWLSTPFCREERKCRVDTGATQIILSIDGKILMECYEGLFDFFTRMIRERLSKYRLADALLVSISG
ncbi:MAG: hypothetical protein J5931_09540 [Prevotella sp.]|nr:hypothetical protein [Prevotella sp.]